MSDSDPNIICANISDSVYESNVRQVAGAVAELIRLRARGCFAPARFVDWDDCLAWCADMLDTAAGWELPE